ncbi:MAG: mono/diheme cytochrome c family protein [Oleiphilaceae bacterium]|jgi:mono/diheme cytochrome c family protein
MSKKFWGLAGISVIGAAAVFHFATLPPSPPMVPPIPENIPFPEIPALTVYDMPTGQVAVSDEPYRATFRSVGIPDLVERDLATGVYKGTPYWLERKDWFVENYYNTLAARKIWPEGKSADTHERGDPVTWEIEPIAQYTPPPCDQPQPTGYDAEGCRYVMALFKDVEALDPEKAKALRDQARRGRDVWFKGTFGNQDENIIHQARITGKDKMNYPWLDTRTRPHRFTKWGLINDPDCEQGDASTNWYDKCQDPHSSGVLGYRKYYNEVLSDKAGNVVYNPMTAPYEHTEIQENKRFAIGHPCVQCHVAFDPTNPPKDPNEPEWHNLNATIGNQHTRQPMAFFQGAPEDHLVNQILMGGRLGTVDTSIVASDWMHNPGTQNNIMDFHNKRVFKHEMKDPVTGEISTANTRLVLKGGEDSVGEHLALIRVYINIGLCTEECWVPNFPYPGRLAGQGTKQSPMRIMQCANECDAWNYADAKMDDLAAFLITGGPTYLLASKDLDGKEGKDYIDLEKVSQGHDVFATECASCHSSKVAPENIRADKNALAKFYEGHVFGKEDYWQHEFTEAERNSPEFMAKYLTKDEQGNVRPTQFVKDGVFGQDWLSNDERIPFNIIGTNYCRALHDNHNEGNIFEEFSSETYKNSESPGSVPTVINRVAPLVGGMQVGEKKIEGGPGYLRNFSLLSAWATAPFLHNNAIGEMTFLEDGSPDYTVKGRIEQFEMAFDELMRSDDPLAENARPQKISKFQHDLKITPSGEAEGLIRLTIPEGTPVGAIASSNPHDALFMKCADLVENKGHQFGIDLPTEDKLALREFLKLM